MSEAENTALIERFEKMQRAYDALPFEERAKSPIREKLQDLYVDYRAAKNRLAVGAAKAKRKMTRQQLEIQRLKRVPELPGWPPRAWIWDGGYAALSAAAQRVLVPILVQLHEEGRWARVDRQLTATLAGVSIRSVSRGVLDLWKGGWIDVYYAVYPADKGPRTAIIARYVRPKGGKRPRRSGKPPSKQQDNPPPRRRKFTGGPDAVGSQEKEPSCSTTPSEPATEEPSGSS